MNNNIQCSIESSTTKIELNSAVDGVFLVPELEGLVGLPEIRTTSGVNAGYDGGWTSAQNYDARLISIRGVIANPDISKVEDKRRAIASLLGQGRKEQLTLRFTTEAGNAYAISVRTISCEMALQRVLTTQEFLIQLRADDPLIYDDGATGGIVAILQPQRALGGFEVNFDLPLAIGGGAEDTVVDNGNETVYPVIKLYGALHSPTVVNRTTNQQMQILADLQYSIDWHTYRSTTGDYILVNGGLDGAPMTLSQLLGNAMQTTYSGKNLLNYGQLAYSFPANANTRTVIGSIDLTAGTTYYITYDIQTATSTSQRNTPYLEINGTQYYENTTSNYNKTTGRKTWQYVAQTTGTYTFGYWCHTPNVAVNIANFMVSKSSDSTFEPYVGGIPSPNPDYPQDIQVLTGDSTVVICGKNLVEDVLTEASIFNAGQVSAAPDFQMNIAPVIRGNTYTMSIDGSQFVYGFFTSKPVMGSVSYDGTRTVVRNNPTFTAPITGYVAFRTSGSYATAQLELGSTATAYEPYQGQSYEVNLGKNLLDNKATTRTYLGVTLTKNNDGSITLNGTSTGNAQFYLNVDGVGFQGRTSHLGAGTYTLNGRDSGGVKFEINYQTANGSSGYSHETFTVAEPFDYGVYVSVTNGTTVNNLRIYPQLERGSQATSYAPYFTPIELVKVGTYQDRIYKSDGKWYIEKNVGKVVLNGSENWSLYPNKTHTFRVGAPHTITNAISDHFTSIPSSQFDVSAGAYTTNTGIFIISYPDMADVASFKTWLANNPTTFYCAGAQWATTTEITDDTLLSQLNFLASLYKGANNISLVGTGAQGEMTIRYATDYTVNQDIITIDSQARTITLNGQDIYHLKTSESEFLVLAPGENKLYLTSEVSDDSGYAEVKFKQGYLSI